MEESDKGENGIDNNINMVVNIKLNDNAWMMSMVGILMMDRRIDSIYVNAASDSFVNLQILNNTTI
jgi:hypothetical protein